jgi:hypothetical protein
MTGQARMVKLAELWKRKTAKGTVYFSGYVGDCQLLMFRGNELTRPNSEVVRTWRLFVQERDPARRPQPKSEQRAEAGQRDTGDPNRPFDDELPW